MKPYLKIIAAMLIWSTWGVLIRWLALPPVVILFYTALIGGVVVPVYFRVRGDSFLTGRNKAWWFFPAISIALLFNNLTFFYALAHTTISNAVFTHYTAPVFVALLAPVLISEQIQRITLISLPLAVAGMTMIVINSGGLQLSGSHLPGILAGTASGVAYAFLIILSRRITQMDLHRTAIVIMLWVSAGVTLPAAFLVDYQMHVKTIVLLLVAGVMHSATAPLLYFSGLRKVMAQHAAILGYIEPLAAIPFAFLFLSETPSFIALFGGLLILLSGYLVIHARLLPNKKS